MRWILRFIKEYNLKYWISNIMIILGSAISKVFPVILLGKIIDEGIYKNNFSCIPYIFIISVSMYFAGRMLTYFGILIIDTVRYKLAHKLKVTCYKKLNELDQEFYQENSLGELNTRLTTDINIIHRSMCFVVKQSMSMLIACILAIIYCLCISPILTLIILIPTPIIAIISNKYIKNSKNLYAEQRESLSDLNSYIQENVEGNRLVKTFGTERKEIDEFKVRNRKVKNKNINIKNDNINYNNKVTFLSYCMQLLLVIFGGIFVIKNYTTIGDFIIINSLISTIKKPFVELSGFVNEWQQFKISVSKVKRLLETEPKIKDEGKLELNNWENITFNNVSLKYHHKQVIKDINLSFKPNKTYAFIGKIGSGKSTIGKLLLRLIEASNGDIEINNIPISEYTLESLRKSIGYVSQTPFLFSDTIANNVSFGKEDLSREEIIDYLKLAKADYVFDLSNDIDTIIGENGVSLSGGEKQRLSLARALSKKPSILILDDITSALDFETELEVTNNINNLKYECTKIIIAQKILSVKNADIIFVMNHGEIIEYGSHEELLQKDGIYKEIYDIQTNNMEEGIWE
ncbi:MAG: ABC transporter ATP-binding protein [Clostridia bacterium]|nr:ABC transporter ATP-binding protein [Clostridia bacterium]